jgi:hypothetical protein
MQLTLSRQGEGAWLFACLSERPSPGDLEVALRHAYHAARRFSLGLAMDERGALVAWCWIETFGGEPPADMVAQLERLSLVWSQVLRPSSARAPMPENSSREGRIRDAILQMR